MRLYKTQYEWSIDREQVHKTMKNKSQHNKISTTQ